MGASDKAGIGARAGARVESHRQLAEDLGLAGFCRMRCIDGKTGEEKWVAESSNIIPTVGLNANLAAAYVGTAYTWYMGLVLDGGTYAAGDTMSSNSWTENEDYDESTRPAWGPGTPSGGVVSNGTEVTFTMNASVTIQGAFLTTNNTKGGTTGELGAEVNFDEGDRPVVSGDIIKVTYQITATDN